MQMVVPQTVRSLTIYNGEVKIIKFTNSFFTWVRVFVGFLEFFRIHDKTYTLYLYFYSQHGFIYSGLYSCSLGYVREFLLLLLFLQWLPLNLIILKLVITIRGGG